MNAKKPRNPRPEALPPQEDADMRDFRDPESERVLDAAADVLVGELARQAAREYFAAWAATSEEQQ